MRDGKLNLRCKDKTLGSVNVHLSFDIPDEMMQQLLTKISNAVDEWHKTIIYEHHPDQ